MKNMVGKIEKDIFLGTGVLISQDIVLTAKHVVVNADDEISENTGEKTFDFVTSNDEKIKGTTVNIAQIICSDDDYALIQLDVMLVEAPFLNLCAPKNDIVGMKCTIEGYAPTLKEKIILTGSICKSNDDCIAINVDENKQLQDYSGLSGSPVYLFQYLIGIVKRQNYKQIEVLPIKKIINVLKDAGIMIWEDIVKDYNDDASKIIMQKTQEAIKAAGPRYSDRLNVTTDSFEHLLYLLNKNSVYEYLSDLYDLTRECGETFEQLKKYITNKNDSVLVDSRNVISTIQEKISRDLERLSDRENVFSCLGELANEYANYKKQLDTVFLKEVECFEEKNGKRTFRNKAWRGVQASYMCQFPTNYLDELETAILSIEKIEEKAKLCKINELDKQVILVTGKGGTGKTHLLCDITNYLISKDIPAVLTYGDWFANSELFSSLFSSKCSQFNNIDDLFEYLDYIGSRQDYTIPICIDAINETDDNNFWNKVLPQFMSTLKKYKNIKLIISCRTIYREEYIKDEIVDSMLEIVHYGFENCQTEAVDAFSDFYGVNITFNSINIPEFINPLMFKMLCEIAQDHPDKTANYHDVQSLMNEYMKIKNKKITSLFSDFLSIRDEMVQCCMSAISEYMSEHDRYSLKWNEVRDVVSDCLQQWDLSTYASNVMKLLISENLLREYDHNDTQLSFGYQRYFEILYAEKLVGLDLDILSSKIKNDEITLGTLEMLQILYKRKYGCEMVPSISTNDKNDKAITTFLQGLYWRTASDFSNETTTIVLSLIKSSVADIIEKTILNLLEIATKPDCPLNALFIHDCLIKFDMLDRTYFLSFFLLKKCDDNKTISNLCERAILLEKDTLDKKAVFLWKVILCWGTSLNDCKLRDMASKGLANLFAFFPEDYEKLYKMFQNVDDDYIHERLWQSIYSSLVLRNDKQNTRLVMDIIQKEILDKNQLTQNVLIRDYLRSIYEYAFANGWCDKHVVKQLRPPYKSAIHNADLNFIEANKNKYKSLYWNCTESDFGVYTIPREVSDYGLTKKDIGNLIFEDIIKLGYSNSACSKHDRYINETYGSLRSRDNEVERIGKKLQKIYLYREVGMVYDNYTCSTKYDDANTIVAPMQGIDFRYIDLTRIPRKNSFLGNDLKYPFYRYDKWDNFKWFKNNDIEQYVKPLLTYNGDNCNEYFILQGYFTSKEPLKEKYREVWMHINAYLYKKKNKGKLLKWLEGKDFEGRWMPEGFNQLYEICVGEYPWCPTMQNIFVEYPENERCESGKELPCEVITTVDDFNPEKDSPFFNEMCDSFAFPSNFWFKNLDLKWDGRYGYNVDGKKAFSNAANNAIYVEKSFLLKFLEDNGYDVMWTVLGEKQILGGYDPVFPGRGEFSFSFFLNENLEIEQNHCYFHYNDPNN